MRLDSHVQWHVKGKSDGPLRFWDALWSVFSESGDFYRLLERLMPVYLQQGLAVNEALEKALQAIFQDVIPYRNRLLRAGLTELSTLGVPRSLLLPKHVGQDWGQTQLTSRGDLTLRMGMWMRRTPATRWQGEASLSILYPEPHQPPTLKVTSRGCTA